MARYKKVKVKAHIRRGTPFKGRGRTHAPVRAHVRRVRVK